MKTVKLDQNYDNKAIGSVSIAEDVPLTPDTILVPEVMGLADGRLVITGFTVIDRDQLITKSHRKKIYGKQDWKGKAVIL